MDSSIISINEAPFKKKRKQFIMQQPQQPQVIHVVQAKQNNSGCCKYCFYFSVFIVLAIASPILYVTFGTEVVEQTIENAELQLSFCKNKYGAKPVVPGSTHLGTALNWVSGRTTPLFDAESFSECRKCDGLKYYCPDGLESVTSLANSLVQRSAEDQVDASERYKEMKKNINANLKFSASLEGIGKGSISGSFSSATEFLQDRSTTQRRVFHGLTHVVQKYEFFINQNQILLPIPQRKLNYILQAIKDGNEDDIKAYSLEFISSYGTHFVTRQPMGGYLNYEYSFSKQEYVETEKARTELKGCIQTEIEGKIKGVGIEGGYGGCANSEESNKAKNLINTMQMEKSVVTYPPILTDVEDESYGNAWKEEIENNPQPISAVHALASGASIEFEYEPMSQLPYFLKELDTFKVAGFESKLRDALIDGIKTYALAYDNSICTESSNGKDDQLRANTDCGGEDRGVPIRTGQFPNVKCTCICKSGYTGVNCGEEANYKFDRVVNVELELHGSAKRDLYNHDSKQHAIGFSGVECTSGDSCSKERQVYLGDHIILKHDGSAKGDIITNVNIALGSKKYNIGMWYDNGLQSNPPEQRHGDGKRYTYYSCRTGEIVTKIESTNCDNDARCKNFTISCSKPKFIVSHSTGNVRERYEIFDTEFVVNDPTPPHNINGINHKDNISNDKNKLISCNAQGVNKPKEHKFMVGIYFVRNSVGWNTPNKYYFVQEIYPMCATLIGKAKVYKFG